jgi:hypothetical protein
MIVFLDCGPDISFNTLIKCRPIFIYDTSVEVKAQYSLNSILKTIMIHISFSESLYAIIYVSKYNLNNNI